jgi:hypothetical protein
VYCLVAGLIDLPVLFKEFMTDAEWYDSLEQLYDD